MNSIDASSKVINQLLLFNSGVLQFGARGVRMLRDISAKYPGRTHNMSNKLLKLQLGVLVRLTSLGASFRRVARYALTR